MSNNAERQSDEISAISSICGKEEFVASPRARPVLMVSVRLSTGCLEVRYSDVVHPHCPRRTYRRFSVASLPPCVLRLYLPAGYPSREAPRYELDVSWLPPWETSLLCQRLDELWLANFGSEILFLWRDFLRFEALPYLRQDDALDASFLYALHAHPAAHAHLLRLCDRRARNSALFLHPMEHLKRYDESRADRAFAEASHDCGICARDSPGPNCTRFDCGHVFCKDCTAEYFAERIRSVRDLICPSYGCRWSARNDQIRELCDDESYARYERTLLARALDNMRDTVHCPRRTCGMPVAKTHGESLARCAYCGHNFCSFCTKAYHGVAPCVFSSADSGQLVEEYLKADKYHRARLAEKYGRRMIQSVVEERLTKEYLKKNTKACPVCKTLIEKVDGCNQMSCPRCFVNFCWICELPIANKNPYDHFIEAGRRNNKCFGRLFEGMPGAENADEDVRVIDE